MRIFGRYLDSALDQTSLVALETIFRQSYAHQEKKERKKVSNSWLEISLW